MTTDLVIGAGGLVGSAVLRRLGRQGVTAEPAAGIRWSEAGAAARIAEALSRIVSDTHGWRVHWCAGAAVTDSSASDFERELDVLDAVVRYLASLPEPHRKRGTFLYTSSAGGVYGGSVDPPCTEHSTPAPLGAYGRAKLAGEAAVRSLADDTGMRVLIARLANVYGPGQNLAKPQGLVSRLCAAAVTRTPLSVYVSLDTLRDYIFVEDCARIIVDAADRAAASQAGTAIVKIIGSGRSVSIAAMLREFQRVLGARPLIVMGASPSAGMQGRDLRLRSVVWPDLDGGPSTTLPEGINRTLEHVRGQLLASPRV